MDRAAPAKSGALGYWQGAPAGKGESTTCGIQTKALHDPLTHRCVVAGEPGFAHAATVVYHQRLDLIVVYVCHQLYG